MIFLQASGLTRFAESQQTWRSGARCAHRRTSTRFPQAKVKVSGIWDNCHCPAWGFLIGGCYTRVNPRVRLHHENRRGANGRSRELTLATRCQTDAQTLRPYGANKGARRRVATARTVCLEARRRLRKGSADVLPVRQRNYSKVDYCKCPRHQPRL